MAQVVSSYTTLDRTVAQIKRDIERADPTAEVVALDFRSATIAKRNSGSAGTHSLRGKSAEGYYVRGAADINVRVKGTSRPHPREWALLNKYGKTLAIRFGLAYTFPKGPNVYLRSHSGASLHLHIDVSIWGTDYGDCYAPYRAGRGGYYRQAHAGRPKASPPKIGASSSSPSRPTGPTQKLDLSDKATRLLQQRIGTKDDGDFGTNSVRALQMIFAGTDKRKRKSPTARRLGKQYGVTVDGVISKPSSLIRAVQAYLNVVMKAGLKVDGLLGSKTTAAIERYVVKLNGHFH